MRSKRYLHAGLTLLLVFSFFTGALSKLVPALQPPGFNKAFLVKTVTEENYARPASFQLMLTAMQQSGFLTMIGLVQLVTCILMAIPKTRLAGLLLLLPMTFNIFMIQCLMNNSLADVIKCAGLLSINLLLVGYYHKRILLLWSPGRS